MLVFKSSSNLIDGILRMLVELLTGLPERRPAGCRLSFMAGNGKDFRCYPDCSGSQIVENKGYDCAALHDIGIGVDSLNTGVNLTGRQEVDDAADALDTGT
jgi:hypothetical protein